jgi:nucleotide-binding universal stress UspA family protein
MERNARRLAERAVAAIGRAARRAGVPFEPLVARAPTAYEGIVEAARRKKCDVIVMASSGRRGLSRLVLGSVTAKVLAHSKIPVLVLR